MNEPGAQTQTLNRLLRRTAVDPHRFGELVAAWNAEFDPDKGLDGPRSLTVEADAALRVIVERGESDLFGSPIAQLINSFPHSVVVASADAVVTGMNTLAMARLDLDVGDPIDRIEYHLDAAELMSEVIRGLARGRSPGEIVLRKAVHEASDRTATFAFVPAPGIAERGRDPSALVFIIDPVGRSEFEALMARAWGLTSAESDVVGAFLDGATLRDIAERRGRSHATVRTQFQAAMSKSGARSQAELMRNTLALSQFVSEISELAEVARHPHRKAAQILRPGGRTLDVVLAGDMQGAPVVFLSTLTHHALSPAVEARLREARLLAVHLWRPGFGRTDTPAPGAAYDTTLAADLRAVLSHLEVDRCTLVGLNSATRDAIDLGGRAPELITRVLVVGPILPRPVQRSQALSAPWAEAIYRTTRGNEVLLRLMVRTGLRAWKMFGTRRFAAMQLGGSPADMAALADPDVIAELDRAMIESNAQGVEANVKDAARAISDWSDKIDACRVPIELVHGAEDPCTDISVSRAYVSASPGGVALTEIAGAGFYTLFSHPHEVIARLSAAVGG